jgi:hypothetical protein
MTLTLHLDDAVAAALAAEADEMLAEGFGRD